MQKEDFNKMYYNYRGKLLRKLDYEYNSYNNNLLNDTEKIEKRKLIDSVKNILFDIDEIRNILKIHNFSDKLYRDFYVAKYKDIGDTIDYGINELIKKEKKIREKSR